MTGNQGVVQKISQLGLENENSKILWGLDIKRILDLNGMTNENKTFWITVVAVITKIKESKNKKNKKNWIAPKTRRCGTWYAHNYWSTWKSPQNTKKRNWSFEKEFKLSRLLCWNVEKSDKYWRKRTHSIPSKNQETFGGIFHIIIIIIHRKIQKQAWQSGEGAPLGIVPATKNLFVQANDTYINKKLSKKIRPWIFFWTFR